jgi:glycosyltransferase involved in cell wall biosynthesis
MTALITQSLKEHQPDGVILDQTFTGVYIPILSACPYVLSTYNVESQVLRDRARGLTPGIGRRLAELEAKRLAKFESQSMGMARRIIACSARDGEQLRLMGAPCPVDVIFNGVDLIATPLLRPPEFDPLRLAFVGSYEYPPNLAAAHVLVEEVWPRVKVDRPKAEVILIGRGEEHLPHSWSDRPGLRILGRVPKMLPALQDVSMLVFPLAYGGGSRLKILEGLASGRPVVTTKAGMEGLEVSGGRELLVGDTSEELARQILRLCQDPSLSQALRAAGRKFVETHHGWDHLRDQFRTSIETAFSVDPRRLDRS